jgi:tRNA splicing ligase
MKHKSVIVAQSRVLHNIMNLYYQYNLIETGDREEFTMAGFVIRKSLNSTIKNILNKM